MLIIVLKTGFAKLIFKNVIYRDYKNCNRGECKRELKGKINENSNPIGEYVFLRCFCLSKISVHQSKLRY